MRSVIRVVRAIVIGALVVGIAACGDDGDGGDGDGAAGQGGSAEQGDDQAAPDTTAATGPAADWEQVRPGGDCQCADGGEYSFWVREADPEKVVFFLQGGGACFSAETCAFTSRTYDKTVDGSDDPARMAGLFDVGAAGNPVADHSIVFVPYCTGDTHVGDATTEYSPGLTVQHKGFVNGTAALDHLAATFPDARDVVVMGESAGAATAPLYGGLVSDRLPQAAVTVVADGAGGYPDATEITARLGGLWGAERSIPEWATSRGVTTEQWSFLTMAVQAALHDPDMILARHDYAHDAVQTLFSGLVSGQPPGDLLPLIDANEVAVEGAGVDLLSYVAPGSRHTVLLDERFYSEDVDGVPLAGWVTDLVVGEPVDDVHCENCTD